MRRREFITFLGTAAAWPIVARAQSKARKPKVGVLMAVSESDPDSQKRIVAFRQGLVGLGWTDGENIQVEYRWADGKIDLIRQYSKELVALTPDVIVANSTPAIQATKEITSSIPIVCVLVNDPGRPRVCKKSVAAGWQHYRLHLHKRGTDWKMDRFFEGRDAGLHSSCSYVQPKDYAFLSQFFT
jgi:ABC-type uncharacterized transport system substrate-binding protein